MSVLSNLGAVLLKPVIREMSRARLPKIEGNLLVKGITGDVEIIRDEWGIPHIYAQNRADAIFAQGYVHAQDRLWQMELNRRAARGKLSEFLGKDALDADRTARTLGYERVGKKDWELLTPNEQDLMKDYCRGINAFLEHSGSRLPVEFELLKLEAEPWTPLDVCAFGRMMMSLLTWGWYDEIMRAKLIEAVGPEAAAEVDNEYPKENPCTLPKGIEFNMIHVDEKFRALSGPYMPQITGSNAWAIHGSKTKTGKPYLCNDPHLILKNPNIWYQVHIHCPELHASGVSAPGLPAILIGHNERISWGITLSYTDMEDVFIEKFTDDTCVSYMHEGRIMETEIIDEKIFVKGEKMPHVERVYNTIHGTVVSEISGNKHVKMTLCSMAYKPSRAFGGWFVLNTAKNWNDFVDGVKLIHAPGLNIVYADADGNIGYYNSGRIPVRSREEASVPMPGWTGENDWRHFVPFEEMPHALNPEQGFIVTANNKIEPEDYPHFLGSIYMNGYRANRLTRMIRAKEKLEPKDFVAMQMDYTCIPGKQFAQYFKGLEFETAELQRYADMLLAWDGVLRPDQVEGSLYQVGKYMAVRKMYEAALPDKQLVQELMGTGFHAIYAPVNSFLGHNTVALFRVLDNPDSFWLKKVGGREKVLKDGFKAGIDWLKLNYGLKPKNWQWGKVHAITFPHAMSAKEPLDKVFNVGPYPIGGDTDTPLQTFILSENSFDGELASASYRQIIDMSDLDRSQIIMPLGNSGNMASPYYKNQLKMWFDGELIPMAFSRKKVEEHARHTLWLKRT